MPAERSSEEIVRVGEAQPEVEVGDDPQGELQAPVQDRFEARPPHAADPALRRRLLPWAIAGVVLVIMAIAGVVFSYSPFFHATTITVSGEGHLSEAAILRIADLGPGTNVVHLDPRVAERRLERDPWIARATVARHLPHTLTVVVVERVPVALASTGLGASPALLAGDGTLLGPAEAGSALPRVSTDDGTGTTSKGELREGARVVTAMSPPLRQQVATVVVGQDGSLLVVTKSGVTVTYGDGSHLVAKAEALEAVLAYVGGAHEAIASVDVSVPGAPTATRPGGLGAVVGR
jgi:cell division protein FtsQ